MRAALIENGVVADVIMVLDLSFMPGLVESDTANIGDTYDEETNTFTPPPPPPAPIPTEGDLLALCRSTLASRLDGGARAAGFLSFADALTYVDEPAVPAYQTAALELRAWRSQCRAVAEQIMTEIRAGALPTEAEITAALPPAPSTQPA